MSAPIARIAVQRAIILRRTVQPEYSPAPISDAMACALLSLEYSRLSGRPVCPGVREFLEEVRL